jgi:hypothetical protein
MELIQGRNQRHMIVEAQYLLVRSGEEQISYRFRRTELQPLIPKPEFILFIDCLFLCGIHNDAVSISKYSFTLSGDY